MESGAACGTSGRICSFLGNDPKPSLLDQDIFEFQGKAGDSIAITLEKDASGTSSGDRASLILKQKGKLSLLRLDRSDLPNQVSATLPKAGAYQVIVGEQPKILRGQPFRGDYCLTLDAPSGCGRDIQTDGVGGVTTTVRPRKAAAVVWARPLHFAETPARCRGFLCPAFWRRSDHGTGGGTCCSCRSGDRGRGRIPARRLSDGLRLHCCRPPVCAQTFRGPPRTKVAGPGRGGQHQRHRQPQGYSACRQA